MKSIKVYGPGCKRCAATEAMLKETAERLGIGVEIEKVTDAKAMAMAGVISTPGVSVDGKLVHTGSLPDKGKLEQWLLS